MEGLTDLADDERDESVVDKDSGTNADNAANVGVIDVDQLRRTLLEESDIRRQLDFTALLQFHFSRGALNTRK